MGIQLNSGTVCVDSLNGMKKILKEKCNNIMTNSDNKKTQDCNTCLESEIHATKELMNAGMFETELIEGQTGTLLKESTTNAWQVENEETPKKRQKTMVICLKERKCKFLSDPEVPKTRKRALSDQCTPSTFKLVDLHNHLLGAPPVQSHGAEADHLALLRTTAVLGIDWLMWVKDNCSLFSDCEKMWG